MKIAIYKMKDDHEKLFESIAKSSHSGDGVKFIELLESGNPSNEDFKSAALAIQNESDVEVKNAFAYIYARAKVASLNGSLGIKSFSVTGNCNMSFAGVSSTANRSRSESKTMLSNESVSARDFDLKRGEMEYASRQSNVVIDKKSYDQIRNVEIRNLLSEITLPSGETAYGLNMAEALRNDVIQNNVFQKLGI